MSHYNIGLTIALPPDIPLGPDAFPTLAAVRVLTLSEIESLQQNKRETTERLMALMGSTVRIA